MYDAVTEILLSEHRLKGVRPWTGYEKPDLSKYRNGDCLKCNTALSVVSMYRNGSLKHFCTNCGEGKY